MISIDVPGGSLDFILPSETAGYIVAVFIDDGGELGDDDFAPTSMMPYGFFTGPKAREEAEAFGERHITPVGNRWRALPVQSLSMHRRLDCLRAVVVNREHTLYGEEWTPKQVAGWFDGMFAPIPGRITLDEGEMMLEVLAGQGVMVRLGRRKAWVVNPDAPPLS